MTNNKRIVPPVPRGTVCEKMCARCPFKPNGSGYAVDHPDMPNIVAVVEQGLPFYCHETVLFDPRTDMLSDEPWPPVQDHFELCRGGHERRMAAWMTKAAAAHGITEDEVKLRAGLRAAPVLPSEPPPAAPATRVEHRLKQLSAMLARMEARLLAQGAHADDALVRRAHVVRADIERTKLLAELTVTAAPAINVGDMIQVKGQPFLVGRINHRTMSGWIIDSGLPGKIDKARFNGTVLTRSNTKLRAAVKHRTKLGGYNGDDKWRMLVAEGMKP